MNGGLSYTKHKYSRLWTVCLRSNPPFWRQDAGGVLFGPKVGMERSHSAGKPRWRSALPFRPIIPYTKHYTPTLPPPPGLARYEASTPNPRNMSSAIPLGKPSSPSPRGVLPLPSGLHALICDTRRAGRSL